jgi:hypothetical protein
MVYPLVTTQGKKKEQQMNNAVQCKNVKGNALKNLPQTPRLSRTNAEKTTVFAKSREVRQWLR